MYCCMYCSCQFEERERFLKHVRRHQNETGFTLRCETCGKSCKTVRQFRDHLRWHKLKEERCFDANGAAIADEEIDGVPSAAGHCRENSLGAESTASQIPSFLDRGSTQTPAHKRSWVGVADFVLSLQAQGVPKRICEDIVDKFKHFGTQVECELKGGASSGPSTQSVSGLANIDTAYKMTEFAKNERGYISPEPQFINNTSKAVSQFVPMAEQIRTVLQCEDDFSFEKHTPNHTLQDISDGSLHAHDKDRLHLIIYFDEFTVFNPIGNKTKKYSIGAIYYTFADMQKRSSLHNIYLAMLFHSSMLKIHSKAGILSPLVKELISLETEGVHFMWKGKMENIKCSVAMIVGDNKGIHQMAGYFTSFHGTSRICRFCHVTTDRIQSCFRECGFKMRTCGQYDSEITQLELDEFDEGTQKIFGIRERCIFNQVPSFHCIERFPVDATHDLFEKGVVGHALEQVLHHFVQMKLFSLDTLNKAIDLFPYHAIDKNSPVPVKKCTGGLTVSQTCSETGTLLRTLPLVLLAQMKLDASVMAQDKKFEVLTGLIDIVQQIMSDEFTNETLADMENKIECWLLLFVQEFPTFRLTPKFHNMVHYPSQVRLHGPVKRFATIRFEAKHQEMKKYLANSKNRMNPTKSMADAHQLTSALVLSKCHRRPGERNMSNSSSSSRVKSLSVDGWTYVPCGRLHYCQERKR